MRQTTTLGKTAHPAGLRVPRGAAWGMVLAWIAVTVYAASNPILVSLVEIGAARPVEGGRNAITLTNLFLLGSLISVVPLAVLFRRDLTPMQMRWLAPRDWGLLTLSAVLSSALTPALFFYALSQTSVSNVALISRIEPPLFLLGALFVLGERFEPRALLASLLALVGAIVIIAAQDRGGMAGIGPGEIAAIAATLSYVASTLVARAGLRRVPLGLFSVYRTVAGVAIYVTGVLILSGPEAFRDLLAPVLWQWIWVYAGIVLVLGQLAWAMALKYARAGDISLATSFAPLAGVLIAMAIVGEDPGPGLVPGAALILLSIAWGHGAFDGLADRAAWRRTFAGGLLRGPIFFTQPLQVRIVPPRRAGSLAAPAPLTLSYAVTPIVPGAPSGPRAVFGARAGP